MNEKFKVPILMYHSIDDSNSVLSIDPHRFKTQMRFLKDRAFNVLSLYEVISCIKTKRAFPDKSVVITFDDGFKNVFAEAFPILQEYGFSATIFLVPNYCGKLNNWPGQPDSIKPQHLLSWNEIREMDQYGIQFGAHTLNHPYLTQIHREEAEKEILLSKRIMEDLLQRKIDLFAYPYGGFDRHIKKIVSQLFIGSCSTNLGFACNESDIYALERIDYFYIKNDWIFKQLLSQNLVTYLKCRNMLRTLRNFGIFNRN